MMIHYIIVARDKNGKVIQTYERDGTQSAMNCIEALIENPTWTISIRQA